MQQGSRVGSPLGGPLVGSTGSTGTAAAPGEPGLCTFHPRSRILRDLTVKHFGKSLFWGSSRGFTQLIRMHSQETFLQGRGHRSSPLRRRAGLRERLRRRLSALFSLSL